MLLLTGGEAFQGEGREGRSWGKGRTGQGEGGLEGGLGLGEGVEPLADSAT